MSPLKVDGEYRGAHATHVHPHRKLGKHRTVITEALPLVNWLIDDPDINSVVLGKLSHASGTHYTPRVEFATAGQKLTALLVSKAAAQSITLNVKNAEAAEKISARIRARWGAEVSGKPMLHQV